MSSASLRLAVLFTCALIVSVAQAAVHDVSFANAQGYTLPAKLYLPAGTGPFPALILMHGCSGMYSNSDPAQGLASLYVQWARRLNRSGIGALIMDSFGPRGADQDQCGNGAGGVSEVNDRPYDAAAAALYLSAHARIDAGRIGAIGWSHGASSVMASLARIDLAGNDRLRVGVSFYPGCGLYDAFNGISDSTWLPNAPFLILHGSIDPLYTSGHCATRLKRAEALGASAANGNPVHQFAFLRAQHGFDRATSATDGFTRADVLAKRTADFTAEQFLLNTLQP